MKFLSKKTATPLMLDAKPNTNMYSILFPLIGIGPYHTYSRHSLSQSLVPWHDRSNVHPLVTGYHVADIYSMHRLWTLRKPSSMYDS